MPFDAFQNNVWTIACSWTENFLPIQTDPAGRGKNGRCLPAAVVVLGGGNACYDFGEKRVATVTLLTITTLPGRRSCGTVMAKFSGHAVTFRSSPTVFAETRMPGSACTRILSGKPPRAIWSAATLLGLYFIRLPHLP